MKRRRTHRRRAKLLDASGQLVAGVPFCPPEGDAGTGMVATNGVSTRTGNVSAGTSVFAMIVLEKGTVEGLFEIDLVTTPHGKLVAMAHSNNCSSEYDAWIAMFDELLRPSARRSVDKSKLYETLFNLALTGDPMPVACSPYCYLSVST